LRAGIGKKPEDYPWSRYWDYLGLRKPTITNPSFILKIIDNSQMKAIRKYREYVLENRNMEDPLKKSYHHIAHGSESFIEKIKEK